MSDASVRASGQGRAGLGRTGLGRTGLGRAGLVRGGLVRADLGTALPLSDGEGRCWWQLSRPYDGLTIRTRHPERSLYLADGTELLVTIGYVRGPRGRAAGCSMPGNWPRQPGAVRRLTITL